MDTENVVIALVGMTLGASISWLIQRFKSTIRSLSRRERRKDGQESKEENED